MSEEPLAAYHRKRDFTRTPEPAGRVPAPDAQRPRFVVQRHRARRLHYDLRFEIGGVLVSWAVPKGPTLDPDVKRMAVHVEDHPIEYLDFEGVIPSGEYGGGDVIVWDIGTWEPHATDDPVAAVAAGDFHADLYGSKLQGRLILVRRGEPGAKEQWLLLHKHDDHAVAGWDPEDHPHSVLSGRTNEEVQRDPDRLWRSDLPAARAAITVRPPDPTADELAALDQLGEGGTWTIFGRKLRLTNLDRVVYSARKGEDAITKRELLAYAARIAPTVLPQVSGRPLLLHRFPDGIGEPGTWQRRLPASAPDWLPRWRDGDATYLVADDPAVLVWAANRNAIEWSALAATAQRADHPKYAVIAIQTARGGKWTDILGLARIYRTAFEHLDLAGFPMLTGDGGLELRVPLAPGPNFDETRAWAQHLANTVDTVGSGLRARADVSLNTADAPSVVAYSPRAAAGAPVATPLAWDELDSMGQRSEPFTIRTVLDRLDGRADPFADLLRTRQQLPDFR